MLEKTKIYIAGPMTGLPNYNFEKFFDAEEILKKKGYSTINPARITNENGGQELFVANKSVAEKIIQIQKCTIRDECYAIALLDGWNNSIGAKAEVLLALQLGLKIFMIDDLI